jgi:uncharacterized protein (UPF0216 family)
MKSAYELAMERLNQKTPTIKLSDGQKKAIAELESEFGAKIAAREIALKTELAKVEGDEEKENSLREHLATDRKKLQAELEEKKERVRQAGA